MYVECVRELLYSVVLHKHTHGTTYQDTSLTFTLIIMTRKNDAV